MSTVLRGELFLEGEYLGRMVPMLPDPQSVCQELCQIESGTDTVSIRIVFLVANLP